MLCYLQGGSTWEERGFIMSDLSENSHYKHLDKVMWETKGSRFNTYRRLKKQGSLSITTISMLSVYAIVISLFQFFFKARPHAIDNFDTFFSILLSICILVVSLLEASKEYGTKSVKVYDCSNDIGSLLHKLKQVEFANDINSELSNISDHYNAILKSCPENHDQIDFDLFKAQNYKHYKINPIMSFYIKAKATFLPYSFYYLLIVAPLLIYFSVIHYFQVVQR